MDECCGNCRFFKTNPQCALNPGDCRRRAPVNGDFPSTYSSGWCGEHEPIKTDEREVLAKDFRFPAIRQLVSDLRSIITKVNQVTGFRQQALDILAAIETETHSEPATDEREKAQAELLAAAEEVLRHAGKYAEIWNLLVTRKLENAIAAVKEAQE